MHRVGTSHRAPRVSRVPAAWLAEGGKGYRVTGGRALRRPLIQAALVTYVWRGPPRQVTCSRCLAVREDVPGGGARHHARMQTCHGGRGSGAVNGADETRPVALARAMVTGHQDNGSQDPSRVTPRSPHQNMVRLPLPSSTYPALMTAPATVGRWNKPGVGTDRGWNKPAAGTRTKNSSVSTTYPHRLSPPMHKFIHRCTEGPLAGGVPSADPSTCKASRLGRTHRSCLKIRKPRQRSNRHKSHRM